MNPETIQFLNKLSEVLSTTGTDIIVEYTAWHQISAFVWFNFGLFLTIAAFKCPVHEDINGIPKALLKGLVCITGLIFISFNIANIFAPEAYAIHQLILDIRGY